MLSLRKLTWGAAAGVLLLASGPVCATTSAGSSKISTPVVARRGGAGGLLKRKDGANVIMRSPVAKALARRRGGYDARRGEFEEDARFFYGDDAPDVPTYGRTRKRVLDWEETDSERGAFLARVYGMVAVQLAVAAAAAYYLPSINNPPHLQALLKSDRGVLKLAAGSVGAWLLTTMILAANGPLRRTFPFNAVLLLTLATALAGVASSVCLQFNTRWPWLALAQSSASLLLSSLVAGRGKGEGLAPVGITTLLTLLPARPMQLVLKWPIREVTTAAAVAFILSTVLIFSAQAGMKRRIAANAFDGASHVYVDLLRGFGRLFVARRSGLSAP